MDYNDIIRNMSDDEVRLFGKPRHMITPADINRFYKEEGMRRVKTHFGAPSKPSGKMTRAERSGRVRELQKVIDDAQLEIMQAAEKMRDAAQIMAMVASS